MIALLKATRILKPYECSAARYSKSFMCWSNCNPKRVIGLLSPTGSQYGSLTRGDITNEIILKCKSASTCKKVKQSRYRPRVIHRVPGKLRFQDFMITAGGKVVRLTHRPPSPPRNYTEYMLTILKVNSYNFFLWLKSPTRS